MEQHAIALTETLPAAALIPPGAGKDAKSRLRRFEGWLQNQAQPWHEPDLAAYRDHLLTTLSPASTAAHLSTIRGRYHRLQTDNRLRDVLEIAVRAELEAQERSAGVADVEAGVTRLLVRMQNATDPKASPVKTVTHQDRPDNDHVRLTAEQASALLAAPGLDTLKGLRDTAVIALMLCTGIREAELVALDVADLRQRLGGELALHVREGKGCKERLIPYGGLAWCLAVVDKWLEVARIKSGPVFRGLHKGGTLRPGRLSVRAVQYIVTRYPVMIGGAMVKVRPHDLRRTYARRLYEAGVDLLAIRDNLGHADHKTTLGYIGPQDVGRRRPPAIYAFDLSKLEQAGGPGQ